jgi:hypothetical protein
MGWSSGSIVMAAVIDAVQLNVRKKDVRKEIYRDVMNTLEEQDWDTLDECLDLDEAYDELYAERYGEEG